MERWYEIPQFRTSFLPCQIGRASCPYLSLPFSVRNSAPGTNYHYRFLTRAAQKWRGGTKYRNFGRHFSRVRSEERRVPIFHCRSPFETLRLGLIIITAFSRARLRNGEVVRNPAISDVISPVSDRKSVVSLSFIAVLRSKLCAWD